GTSPELITRLGTLVDRMSVNIELPSEQSLIKLCPQKTKQSILSPMKQISRSITQSSSELTLYRHTAPFAPAGQSTQMIIGATPDSDLQILRLSEGLYNKYKLKRVFYSAYIPVGDERMLPAVATPMLREHRLYQADWLLRFYGFNASEILDESSPSLDIYLDPKCNWAVNHLENFPVEINKAPYDTLLRVPGIGVITAKRIVAARRSQRLDFDHLKRMGIVLKRAQYFITCSGKLREGVKFNQSFIYSNLVQDGRQHLPNLPREHEQLSLLDPTHITMLSSSPLMLREASV
ncbi:MAG TPA: putative DNA modification/repair radical SAM protein, partial [Oscillospiraceae bacterium]|nr:putative DNA modification/repair radical SAM protein [Oscillospiraceae bacterium]